MVQVAPYLIFLQNLNPTTKLVTKVVLWRLLWIIIILMYVAQIFIYILANLFNIFLRMSLSWKLWSVCLFPIWLQIFSVEPWYSIFIVVADRIVRAFNMFGGIRSVVRDMLKLSDRVFNTGFHEKHTLCEKFRLNACNLIRKRLQHRCFPMKFLRTRIL